MIYAYFKYNQQKITNKRWNSQIAPGIYGAKNKLESVGVIFGVIQGTDKT